MVFNAYVRHLIFRSHSFNTAKCTCSLWPIRSVSLYSLFFILRCLFASFNSGFSNRIAGFYFTLISWYECNLLMARKECCYSRSCHNTMFHIIFCSSKVYKHNPERNPERRDEQWEGEWETLSHTHTVQQQQWRRWRRRRNREKIPKVYTHRIYTESAAQKRYNLSDDGNKLRLGREKFLSHTIHVRQCSKPAATNDRHNIYIPGNI